MSWAHVQTRFYWHKLRYTGDRLPEQDLSEFHSQRDLARRLLALDAEATPESFALASRSAYARVSEMLARWVGTEGCRALVERAHIEAWSHHPALEHLRNGNLPVPRLEDIEQSARTHGTDAATDGVVSMLEQIIGLLSRLIGEDLTVTLMEQCIPPAGTDTSKGNAS